CDERRCAAFAAKRDLADGVVSAACRKQIDHESNGDRADQDVGEAREQRAAVAQDVAQFFGQNGEEFHALALRAELVRLTNASSRSSPSPLRTISAGVPEATRRPDSMTTIWSESSATSAIAWLESRIATPSARNAL